MQTIAACKKKLVGLNTTQLRKVLTSRGITKPGRSFDDCVAKIVKSNLYELLISDCDVVLKEMATARSNFNAVCDFVKDIRTNKTPKPTGGKNGVSMARDVKAGTAVVGDCDEDEDKESEEESEGE